MNQIINCPRGCDLLHKPKIVYLYGDLEDDKIKTFCTDFQEAIETGQGIIPVLIHSDGGEIFDATQIVSLFRTSPVPVATIVTGKAYSSAALIFSSGTEGYRYMDEQASMMFHDVEIEGLEGKAHDICNEAEELQRNNRMLWELIARNCGQRPHFFYNKVKCQRRSELYVSAQQAKEWNVANHIGVPQFITNVNVTQTLSIPKTKKRRRR